MGKCKYCKETIQDGAVKCKHCGENQSGSSVDSVLKLLVLIFGAVVIFSMCNTDYATLTSNNQSQKAYKENCATNYVTNSDDWKACVRNNYRIMKAEADARNGR